MTEEFTRCPRCVVGIIPSGGACLECELPDPAGVPPGPESSAKDRPGSMTLDQFRAWLGEPPDDADTVT